MDELVLVEQMPSRRTSFLNARKCLRAFALLIAFSATCRFVRSAVGGRRAALR
jgi:hypothetical protein